MTKTTLKKTAVYVSSGLLLASAALPAFAQQQVDLIPSAIAPVSAGPNDIVRFIINALIIIGVIASLIFLIWGGIRWVLSGGDKGKVDAARGTIVAAIVGLVVIILAYVILNTVLTIITGSGISGFKLPSLTDPEAQRITPAP